LEILKDWSIVLKPGKEKLNFIKTCSSKILIINVLKNSFHFKKNSKIGRSVESQV